MIGRRLAVLASVLAALPTVPVAAQQATVDTLVRAFIARQKIPGAAIAVVHNGRMAVSGGYGTANLESNVPVTRESVFEIGSISKLLTAAATMRLAEQGKLTLGDPIFRYVPGLPNTWSAITVGHLLTHTGGVPDWESKTAFSYRKDYSARDFVTLISSLPLDFAPGDRFTYTNSGAPLLGIAIASVSGMPFERFVTEQLFVPAGLKVARFKSNDEVVANKAGGYVDSAGTLRGGEPKRPGIIAPSGGAMSTAEELARWMYALGTGALLKPTSVEQMLTPVRLNNGMAMSAGIGVFLDAFHGHRIALHNGSTVGGYSSVVYWYPDERLAVAVLFNIDRFNAVNTLATRLAGVVVPGLSISSLSERADPDPAFARRVLQLLKSVSERRDDDLLASHFRVPGGAPRTNPAFGFAGTPDKFAFLEREDMGAEGTSRFGNVIRWIYRYRLMSSGRNIDYTFEVNTDGKIARFLAEPQ
jgi:CubicO group peptidase (beta-lactamase class C family)